MTSTREYVTITMPDGVAEAYVSVPEGEQELTGVLLYMDAIGLRPQIEQMADRIASWGHAVLAPNVFHRDATAAEIAPKTDLREPGAREEFFPTVMPLLKAHTPDLAARDLPAYVDTLLVLPRVGSDQFGITGYCMGGVLALRAAAQLPDQVAAIGMFHAGGAVTGSDDSPHLLSDRVRAQVLARFADHDRSATPEQIRVFDDHLTHDGVTFSSSIYQDAQHGYTMADTSMYDEASAEKHFEELQALFSRALPQLG